MTKQRRVAVTEDGAFYLGQRVLVGEQRATIFDIGVIGVTAKVKWLTGPRTGLKTVVRVTELRTVEAN